MLSSQINQVFQIFYCSCSKKLF